MNMITTDEGRRENGGSDTNTVLYIVRQSVVSVLFKFCHAFHAGMPCLYTYINHYSSHRY